MQFQRLAAGDYKAPQGAGRRRRPELKLVCWGVRPGCSWKMAGSKQEKMFDLTAPPGQGTPACLKAGRDLGEAMPNAGGHQRRPLLRLVITEVTKERYPGCQAQCLGQGQLSGAGVFKPRGVAAHSRARSCPVGLIPPGDQVAVAKLVGWAGFSATSIPRRATGKCG